VGIKYDNIAKVLYDNVNSEGLHFGPPGFSFIIFPSVYKTMEFKDISVFFLSEFLYLNMFNLSIDHISSA
jgi:hypothetical protein